MIITLLTLLAFSFFPLGQLARISFLNQQINIYCYEIILGVILIVLLHKYRLKPFSSCRLNLKSFYLFFAVMAFSFLVGVNRFSPFENLVGFLYYLRLLFYFVYLLFFLHHVENDRRSRKFIRLNLVLSAVLIILIAITQYFLYPDLRNLYYQGWDPHLYRAFGLFFDTSVSAAIYGLFFLYFLFNLKKHPKMRHGIFPIIFLILVTLTFSRSVYISIIVTIVAYFVEKKSFKNILVLFFVFVTLIFLVPKPSGEGVNLKRLFSVNSRLKDYQTALNIWQKQPLFGVGYNRIRYVKKQFNLIDNKDWQSNHAGASFHSSFLIIFVTGGIVGLIAFLYLLYELARLNSNNKYYFLFAGLLSLSDNIILHPFVLFILITLSLIPPSDK